MVGGNPPSGSAQSLINREHTITAAYLYTFGRYVTWPEDTFVVNLQGIGIYNDLIDIFSRLNREQLIFHIHSH